jgi:hypothetical protein
MSIERIDDRYSLEPNLRLYLARNFLTFPTYWQGARAPLIEDGFHSASRNQLIVADWWRRWPRALVALATGKRPQGSGLAIVDLDTKNGKNGVATLADLLGTTALPCVPRVHTPSGGMHLWFQAPPKGCHSTIDVGGKQRPGLGPGIDFKCDRSQCHAPGGSPSSPYAWDDQFNLWTLPHLMPLPPQLIPVEVEIPDEEDAAGPAAASTERPANGNDRLARAYVEAAIIKACDRIRRTAPGNQRQTLNNEALGLGGIVAGLGLGHSGVVEALTGAGLEMRSDARKPPWTRHDVRKTVLGGFNDGLLKPKRPNLGGRR